jgi:hypothetical protein
MNGKGVMASVAVVTATALFILGCAGSFGRLKVEEGGMTLDTLIHNWQQYNIYFFGTTASSPAAVLFDPKNDGKNLEVEGLRWQRIRDESTVRVMVGRVEVLTGGVPRLFKIVAPDDSIYGYVYTPANTLSIAVVNENTMRVGW